MNIFYLIRLSFIFSFVCFINTYSQQDNLNSNIKNESNLEFEKNRSTNRITDVEGATYCHGELNGYEKELLKIGISTEKLKNEFVQCTVGDFDGNGYLDFVIWGLSPKEHKSIRWSDCENYFVVFFEKNQVIHSAKIKTEKGSCLVHYPKRKTIGENGEPISKNDALCVWGSTDGYDDYSKGIVYFYDTRNKEFKTIKFGH